MELWRLVNASELSLEQAKHEISRLRLKLDSIAADEVFRDTVREVFRQKRRELAGRDDQIQALKNALVPITQVPGAPGELAKRALAVCAQIELAMKNDDLIVRGPLRLVTDPTLPPDQFTFAPPNLAQPHLDRILYDMERDFGISPTQLL